MTPDKRLSGPPMQSRLEFSNNLTTAEIRFMSLGQVGHSLSLTIPRGEQGLSEPWGHVAGARHMCSPTRHSR